MLGSSEYQYKVAERDASLRTHLQCLPAVEAILFGSLLKTILLYLALGREALINGDPAWMFSSEMQLGKYIFE